MTTYDEISSALRAFPGSEFGTGASSDQISSAEAAVGKVPHDYRRFLEEFGWADFGPYEIAGLGVGLRHPHMNFVNLTEFSRLYAGLPRNMIGFYNDGAGNIACFSPVVDSASSSSAAVFGFVRETHALEKDAESFPDYLAQLLAWAWEA